MNPKTFQILIPILLVLVAANAAYAGELYSYQPPQMNIYIPRNLPVIGNRNARRSTAAGRQSYPLRSRGGSPVLTPGNGYASLVSNPWESRQLGWQYAQLKWDYDMQMREYRAAEEARVNRKKAQEREAVLERQRQQITRQQQQAGLMKARLKEEKNPDRGLIWQMLDRSRQQEENLAKPKTAAPTPTGAAAGSQPAEKKQSKSLWERLRWVFLGR